MTEFADVYERFLIKAESYSFLELKVENREHVLKSYLFDAIARFQPFCDDIDLNDYDEDIECFNQTLDNTIIYILAENMVLVWLKKQITREETLRNMLNEKDYSAFSPANLLNALNDAYKELNSECYNFMNDYSLSKLDTMKLFNEVFKR